MRMTMSDFKYYFKKLAEETCGDTTNGCDIIDWEDGTSLDLYELKEEYCNYLEIVDDIYDFVDTNELDEEKDEDREKILKYAEERFGLSDEYFYFIGGFRIVNFIPYMRTKLNK